MLPIGKYKTANGSIMVISIELLRVNFNWIKENACYNCIPELYDNEGYLTWHCDICSGGKAKLELILEDNIKEILIDKENIERLKRPIREELQIPLIDIEPSWKEEWWGMPAFDNDIIHPQSQITVNLLTDQDRLDFAEKLGIKLTYKSDSIWYPSQQQLSRGEFFYDGKPTDSRYPICIPSKGRADCQLTGKVLDKMGVSYHFFVEETEGDLYKDLIGENKVIVMPFHDLGQGSIPARNYIWDWCKERGYKRHWTIDDNIKGFSRAHLTHRLSVKGGGFFQAMEDFVDRYENIAMAGPHHVGFATVGWSDISPYLLNTRVYSCILLDTTLLHRWRGRYNEDTDLSLRLLKEGYVTCVFISLLMAKYGTAGNKNAIPMKGGNTDNVYNTGDYRLSFAESLREQHPDCVKVVWKFNRWHHQVDYSRFKNNKCKLKKGITKIPINNEYGMKLTRQKQDSL